MEQNSVLLEKLTEEFSSVYIDSTNHTNYSLANSLEDVQSFREFLEKEDWNFLGIAKAPYNPYGRHFDYCAVFEDKDNDCEIIWHHVPDFWIDRFLKELGNEFRWEKPRK